MDWIQENLSSLLVGIGLILLLAFTIVSASRRKKTSGGCGLNCASCRGCPRMQETEQREEAL